MFKGKKLSILGDSLSTYSGVSNDKNTNAMLWYNRSYYGGEFPLEKTYWMRLINELGFELCVNNSYSGGTLSGADNEDAGINRVEYLSKDDGTDPDFIIVFMGTNDLGRGINVEVFAKDYKTTLFKIKNKYPEAKVCCVNLPDRDESIKERAETFNKAIGEGVAEAGENFFVADFFNCRLNNDFYYLHTLDGLHPSEYGMEIIAEVIRDAFLANCR